MKQNIKAIQHIGIPTNDMRASIDFYKSIGFDMDYEKHLDNGIHAVFMKLNGVVFELYTEKANTVYGAINHIALDVEDVEKAFAEAKALKLNIDDKEIQYLPMYQNGVRYFTVIGPNNERVEFNQML